MQPELQAIVGHEATQLMRFETEHRGYRDKVGVRADCMSAALAGWKRRCPAIERRRAIDTINSFFDIAQLAFAEIEKETPMLDLTAELDHSEGMRPCELNLIASGEGVGRSTATDPVPVEVQTFESPFGKARVVLFSDGTPWFVAKDVCESLGLSGGSMSRHVDRLNWEQRQTLTINVNSTDCILKQLYSGRGSPRLIVITRGGFNTMLRESRKPIAREYCQWVDNVVLPALPS